MDRAAFAAALDPLGIELTDNQLEAFESFETSLYEANTVMNLTRVPREECYLRHFVDSLLLCPSLPALPCRLLDLGTGPGFPGWPLACALPKLRVTAVDSSGKMIGFLNRHPLPNLDTLQMRAEDWSIADRYDVVTGRALAPLSVQLELSVKPCKIGGYVIPMRTPADLAEMERLTSVLGLELLRIDRRVLPGLEVERVFPVYKKVRRTPPPHPRPWAEIKRHPI